MYGPSSVGLSPPTTSYTPIEGQTLPTVTCSSDCNPICTYSWTKDRQPHTTGSDLQLTNITPGQTGVYRCTASNRYGSQTSSDVTVTVKYGPSTATLSPPDTTYTRTEGDTLPDITCTADCRPDCTFVWTKPDNTNLTASAVLSLGQLGRSEHGTYKCTAGNIYGSSTISAVVNVQFGPGTVTLSPPDTTYTKTEGDALPDITCTADCRPGCTFVWTRPDNTNSTASPVLSLGQLDRSERGTYRCTARNVVRELTTITSVTILYGPSTVSLTPSTTSYTPIEGQTLPTVTCSSDCNPVCTYSWTKDGQPHTTGSGLQLTNIQRGRTGVYRCTASNGYGSRTSSDVSVTVKDGPGTSTSISPPDTNYTRTEGNTLPNINCTADCRPGCSFVWTKPDNTNFTASAVLSLGQLDKSEHGTYRCSARNVVGESTTTVTVSVMYGPSSVGLSPPTTSYTLTEGQTLPTVTCSSDCNPVCTYSWTKDGQSHTTGSDLQLTNIQRGQTGVYRCTASNGYGSRTSSDVSVTVKYGPGTSTSISPPDTTYTWTEGDTLPNITCTADCKPGCTFVWTKPDNTNLTASAVLSLGQLDRSQHGTYRCTARNIAGESTTSVIVTVQFPPEIDSLEYNQGDADVTEHGSKTLICKVESVPSSTITWYYKNNGTKLFTATDVLESNYTLTTAGCLDTGLYTCSARNSVSNTAVTKDIRINVLCSPRLDPRVFTDQKMGLATHDNLTMNAMFLSNPEPSSFIWTFQNSSNSSFTELNNGTDNFVIHNTPFTSNLSALSMGTRTNMQEAWFGLYNVTAINSEGKGTLTFTVAATGKPNPPYEGSAVCPNTNSAILSWRSAFNGGDDQTFAVGRRQSEKDHFVIDQTPPKILDPGQHQIINITVFGLTPGTQHFFTVYAVNNFGNSTFKKDVNCTTKVTESSPENSPLGAILGGVGGCVVAIIVIVVIVVIIKARRKTSGKSTRDDDTEMIPRDRRSVEDDSSDGMKPNILYESSDGLKNNILYESVEAQPGTSSEYAVVQKPSKGKPGSPDAVYAVVNKPKTEQLENVNDVYAEVKKTKNKLGKGKQKEGKKKQKGKDEKKKTKGGKGNQNGAAGDAYEQVDAVDGTGDNIYANCDGGTAAAADVNPSRKKNKDGLIYLDLEFKDDNQNGRNFIIHGIENKTDYVDVDFTKHADPLPPDNEEDQQPAETKNN
ncbi:hemicentin-2-like [Mizuhopecten yessoensis]|uniref:hemicentin-2-like n=1 Tax=Mizuhopecten yessoensis TaxID=6573 RepID=UPI000B458F54|nr:hemicentin-2-like [Mizuhopecten yessoensis]